MSVVGKIIEKKKKYKHPEVFFCKCGRIHIVDEAQFENLANKEDSIPYALVCSGCGSTTIHGLDYIGPDEFFDSGAYNIYSYDIDEDYTVEASDGLLAICRDKTATTVSKIVYSKGIKVPMMNGEYSQYHMFGVISNSECPRMYRMEELVKECGSWESAFRKWAEDSSIVDMERLIRENDEEDLELISHYLVHALNWSGTKFDKFGGK